MKLKDICDILEEIAPLELGEDWDNNGIQIDTGKGDINKILFALEINRDVLCEAISNNIDLIVTHHPLIFNKLHRIAENNIPDRYILELIRNDISVYSSHTNFDKAKLGNNIYLSQLLKLENVNELDTGIGVLGLSHREMSFRKYILYLKEVLNLPDGYIKSIGNLEKNIKSVALCTGAGGDIIYTAKNLGVDLVITGDVKFNIAQDARGMDICLIDAGHFGTEKIFAENIKVQFDELTRKRNFSVETFESKSNLDPYNSYEIF